MSIAYVTDGVTDLDSLLFNPIIDAVNGKGAGGIFNVGAYDTPYDAVEAADDAGGGIVAVPPGIHELSSLLTIPAGVSLIGSGMGGAIFSATHASAGIYFADGSYTHNRDFGFDGNDLATTGVVAITSNGGAWENIQVTNVAGKAFRIQNVQNAYFSNLELQRSHGGLWVDDGSGSCVFSAVKANDNRDWQVKVGSSGDVASGYTEPVRIIFDSLMAEWIAVAPTGDAVATVLIEGLAGGVFLNSNFTGAGALTKPCFKVSVEGASAESSFQLIASTIIGSPVGTTAFSLTDNSRVDFVGRNTITGALVGVVLDGTSAFLSGPEPFLSSVTTPYSYTNGALAPTQRINVDRYARIHYSEAAFDRIYSTQIDGESGARFVQYTFGTMEWGDGAGALDTNLRRDTANILKTDDKFIAELGIGVGNSAAATTLGTVTDKIEVFDTSGNSLGFLPVYDGIA
jgi:hypothetical protein